ncbi:MAG: hypothetical protein WBW08_06315 [Methyloceanibacter sp.]
MPGSPHLFAVTITLRGEFETGNADALFQAIRWCCEDNLPLPQWAAIAFIERYNWGKDGEIRSWDEVFGRPTRYATLERLKTRSERKGTAMVFELRRMEFLATGPTAFFAGDADGVQQAGQWISGVVKSELPPGKSLALHQLTVLLRARDLLDGEIERLKRHYDQEQQSL